MTDSQGKLVKKGQLKALGYLELQDYPWLNFKEETLLFPDNPRKSVVRHTLHTESEMKDKVREPALFERAFGPRARTLIPTDLTEEYIRSEHEITLRKRKRMLDDEELFNLELADLHDQGENLDGIWSKRGEPGAPDSPKQAAVPQTSTPRTQVAPLHHAAASVAESQESVAAATSVAAPVAQNEAALQRALDEARARGFAEGLESGRAAGQADGFAQGSSEGRSQGFDEGHTEGLSQGAEEGRASSEGAGFAEGEAKGVAAAEARADRYFSLLAATFVELETLKREMLLAGQDIFVEIANLATEKIIRQKLGASDESLRKVFEQAIGLYDQTHRLTLEMSPSDAARMREALTETAKARGTSTSLVLRENPALEAGDFKIESDKEILTVDLKRAVEGLIEDLRGELFPEVGTTAAADNVVNKKAV